MHMANETPLQQLLNSKFPYTVFDVEPLQKCKDEPITGEFWRQLSSSPWLLIVELTLVIVGATTFVSHTAGASRYLKISQEISRMLGFATS